MQRNLVPILGVLSLALLCLVCIRWHAPQIQRDLTFAGRQQLRDAKLDPRLLVVDGRDAILQGQVDSDSDRLRMIEMVATINGMRGVDDRLTIASGKPASTGSVTTIESPGTPVRFASTKELQTALDAVVSDRAVEFETEKASLTPLGRSVLDQVYVLLAGQPLLRIGISGHTDHRGDASYNLDLSRLRAEAALDYLVGKGLARDRFESAGFGETRPVAENETPEGRRSNHRIEFTVLPESTVFEELE